MIVLGLTDGITCGAAVIRNGVVLAAVNEERLSRLKMAYGFPRQSIAEVLRIAGLAPNDIDLVAQATANNPRIIANSEANPKFRLNIWLIIW